MEEDWVATLRIWAERHGVDTGPTAPDGGIFWEALKDHVKEQRARALIDEAPLPLCRHWDLETGMCSEGET